MKMCKKCGEIKDFDKFYKDKGKKHGVESCCKQCRKDSRKHINRPDRWIDVLLINLHGHKTRGKKQVSDKVYDRRFIKYLFKKQKGKCYYTGIEMKINDTLRKPSLDRLDSNKGYVENNVVLCCMSINYAKSTATEEEFKSFLGEIK